MKWSWLARCGLALALCQSAWAQVPAITAAACAGGETVYLGSDGPGLRTMCFDARSGQLSDLRVVADLDRPRWVATDAAQAHLYVAVDGSGAEGRVVAYRPDRVHGGLTLLNEVGAGGEGTTYLMLDVASQTLLAANFGGGSVSSIAVQPGGRVGPRVATLKATGSGPHRRQTRAHAHHVVLAPGGRFALVADMGADRVFVHEFDAAAQALRAPADSALRAWVAPAGSGPRRVVFSADGRHVYVLTELTAELITLHWDDQTGRLTQQHSQPLSTPGFQGEKSASEVVLSPDGRHLYVADRGESTLLVYEVVPGSGALTLMQRIPSGGEAPWALALHPSGRWLVVANYRSHRVNVFRIDLATGRLDDTGQALETPRPVSVTFLKG